MGCPQPSRSYAADIMLVFFNFYIMEKIVSSTGLILVLPWNFALAFGSRFLVVGGLCWFEWLGSSPNRRLFDLGWSEDNAPSVVVRTSQTRSTQHALTRAGLGLYSKGGRG